jgi:acyl carrier protein
VTDVDTSIRTQVLDGICALLPAVLKREIPDAGEHTALMDDLGMSSTTALELILELEERLEREISVEDLDRDHFATAGTLSDYVAANLLPE